MIAHYVRLLHTTGGVVKSVFSRTSYLMLALFLAGLAFFFFNLVPYASLFWRNITSSELTFFEKFALFLQSFLVLESVSGIAIALLALFASILLGINIALAVYYVQLRRDFLGAQSGTSILGALGSTLGIGCVSCGSVLFSVLGISGAAALLPLGGREFMLLGIVLLFVSLVNTASRIMKSGICNT